MGELEKHAPEPARREAEAGGAGRERERGTAKGRTYEEAVADAIDRDRRGARRRGRRRRRRARPGGRKGDVLVVIDGPPARLRRGSSSRSRTAARASPTFYSRPRRGDAAARRRLRGPGRARCRRRCRPAARAARVPGRQDRRRVRPRGRLDPRAGVRLPGGAHARDRGARGPDEIDAAAVRATVARASRRMDDVRKIKSQLTSAQNGIGSAKELVDAVEARVRGSWTRSTPP